MFAVRVSSSTSTEGEDEEEDEEKTPGVEKQRRWRSCTTTPDTRWARNVLSEEYSTCARNTTSRNRRRNSSGSILAPLVSAAEVSAREATASSEAQAAAAASPGAGLAAAASP